MCINEIAKCELQILVVILSVYTEDERLYFFFLRIVKYRHVVSS